MEKVVIVSACRTPIGKMGGALSSIPAVQLGALVIKEALIRAGIRPDQVEEVYMGNAIQAGNRPNPARQAGIYAGIPVEIPETSVNVLCGSGLHAVNIAAKMIGWRAALKTCPRHRTSSKTVVTAIASAPESWRSPCFTMR